MTLSVAEKINAFSAGNNGACSDRRSREDKYGGSQRYRAGVVAITRHSRTNDLTTSKALQWAIK